MRAQIVTPWIGAGSETDPYRPLAGDLWPLSWQDVTGQPAQNIQPDPNLFVIEVQGTPAVMAEIEADGRFSVLWSE